MSSTYKIASYECVSNGENGISFTNIPQQFDDLQLYVCARAAGTAGIGNTATFYVGINGNSQSIYDFRGLYSDGSSVLTYNSINIGATLSVQRSFPISSVLANTYGVGIIDFYEYKSTTKHKVVKSIAGFNNQTPTGTNLKGVGVHSGAFRSLDAINSLTFFIDNGFATKSTIDLYGVFRRNA